MKGLAAVELVFCVFKLIFAIFFKSIIPNNKKASELLPRSFPVVLNLKIRPLL
jgi:hypothetical protein